MLDDSASFWNLEFFARVKIWNPESKKKRYFVYPCDTKGALRKNHQTLMPNVSWLHFILKSWVCHYILIPMILVRSWPWTWPNLSLPKQKHLRNQPHFEYFRASLIGFWMILLSQIQSNQWNQFKHVVNTLICLLVHVWRFNFISKSWCFLQGRNLKSRSNIKRYFLYPCNAKGASRKNHQIDAECLMILLHFDILSLSLYQYVELNPSKILWKSAANPSKILWKSFEDPLQILWKSAANKSFDNLLQILWKSFENPLKILRKSFENPSKILGTSPAFNHTAVTTLNLHP